MGYFLGQILLWPSDQVPKDWVICDGRPFEIKEYDKLYSLLGTTYGGDGREYFNIPNLKGRIPIGFGQGKWLSNEYVIGRQYGESHTYLHEEHLPQHLHAIEAKSLKGDKFSASLSSANNARPEKGLYLGKATTNAVDGLPTVAKVNIYGENTNLMELENALTWGASKRSPKTEKEGKSVPIENMPPLLAMNYIMLTKGDYPVRP